MKTEVLFILSFFTTLALGAQIRISRVSDLQFGTSAQGDPSLTINANSAASGQYRVTGDAGRTYQIILPSGSINLRNGGATIAVSNFQSQPAGGNNGVLDNQGQQLINVGATHAALANNQATGNYRANLNVGVQYLSGGPTRFANTQMNQTTIASIAISKLNDLTFGEITQGDPARTIASGNTGSASFTINGQPNRSYNIRVPSSVNIQASSGGTLTVQNFESTPANSGNLGASGTQTLSVGATLPAIANNQATGSYSGAFSVTVIYQ